MKNLQNYTDLAIIQPGVAVLALLTTRVSVRPNQTKIFENACRRIKRRQKVIVFFILEKRNHDSGL
jgi:hypothetical protein